MDLLMRAGKDETDDSEEADPGSEGASVESSDSEVDEPEGPRDLKRVIDWRLGCRLEYVNYGKQRSFQFLVP